jgi:hypothetical protein
VAEQPAVALRQWVQFFLKASELLRLAKQRRAAREALGSGGAAPQGERTKGVEG